MKIIENKKGFKIIEITPKECLIWGGYGICDSCNECICEKGYYVAVLHCVMCEKCYQRWYAGAKRYAEDIPIEKMNFLRNKRILESQENN